MKIFKLIKDTYKSTILCIKYPFLYTRNRFTGEHYTNWGIQNKIQQLRKKYNIDFSFLIKNEQYYSTEIFKQDSNNKWEINKSFDYRGYTIHIAKTGDCVEIIAKHDDKTVKKCRFRINNILKQYNLSHEDVEDIFFRTFSVTNFMGEPIYKNQILFVIRNEITTQDNYFNFQYLNFPIKSGTTFKIKFLEFLDKLIAMFHVFPSHTELDALVYGWRIKFGEDICKEIRNSLLLTYIKNENPSSLIGKIKCYYKGVKLLFSYRIVQIKEKFGGLRLYAYGDTEDTLRIIRKYEDISEHTCIVCGNDATYRSTGWICPYCEEHKPEGSVKINK